MNITRTEQDEWIEQERREKREKEYLLKSAPIECRFCLNCELMFNPDKIEHLLFCEVSEEEITKNFICLEAE